MATELEKYEQMFSDILKRLETTGELDQQKPIVFQDLPFKEYGINPEQLEAHIANNVCKLCTGTGIMIKGVCTICHNTGKVPEDPTGLQF